MVLQIRTLIIVSLTFSLHKNKSKHKLSTEIYPDQNQTTLNLLFCEPNQFTQPWHNQPKNSIAVPTRPTSTTQHAIARQLHTYTCQVSPSSGRGISAPTTCTWIWSCGRAAEFGDVGSMKRRKRDGVTWPSRATHVVCKRTADGISQKKEKEEEGRGRVVVAQVGPAGWCKSEVG